MCISFTTIAIAHRIPFPIHITTLTFLEHGGLQSFTKWRVKKISIMHQLPEEKLWMSPGGEGKSSSCTASL